MYWFLFAQQAAASNPLTSWISTGLLAALLLIFAVDKVLSRLKARGIDLQVMATQLNALHDWHDHEDPDQPGVKIWWNQKYVTELIKELATNQRDVVLLIKEIRREQGQTKEIQESQIQLIADMIKSQEALQNKLENM